MAGAGDLTLSELISSDLERYTGRPGRWWTALLRGFGRPGLWASLVVRSQERLLARGCPRLAGMMRGIGLVWVGIDVAAGARIGPGVWFEHPNGIVIGNGVVIGTRVTINQGVSLGVRNSGETRPRDFPVIGDGVILGARASVFGAVRVADGAVVGAHSLVLDDVEPGALVMGVPARPRQPD